MVQWSVLEFILSEVGKHCSPWVESHRKRCVSNPKALLNQCHVKSIINSHHNIVGDSVAQVIELSGFCSGEMGWIAALACFVGVTVWGMD